MDLEQSINNFTDYCLRILNKRGYSKYAKTPSMYCVVSYLELLADEYKGLVGFMNDSRLKLSPSSKQAYSSTAKLLRALYELHYDFSEEKAISMAREHDEHARRLESLLKRTKSAKEAIVVQRLSTITYLTINTMGQLLVLHE